MGRSVSPAMLSPPSGVRQNDTLRTSTGSTTVDTMTNTVTYYDSHTGMLRDVEYPGMSADGLDYYVHEGNMSCDCNRVLAVLGPVAGDPPCGESRCGAVAWTP